MEVNEKSMKEALATLLTNDEKSLCPVYGMIKKKVSKMTHTTSEYCYITITNKGRLVMYRFDDHTSRPEIHEFITLTFGEADVTQQGLYIANLEFLTDSGAAEVNFTFQPVVKDKDFPKQEKNSEKLYKLLKKLTGDEIPE
ncbi:MAG: hypothetical protein IJT87_06115 [Ruminiclostridium sp.]|nr:hypothetical protein [Ruminiclostridium sp.]